MISRTTILVTLLAFSHLVCGQNRRNQPPPPAREPVAAGQLVPPATPLVACDPYFSVWSQADRLTDKATTHWTGKSQPLNSVAKIDGNDYRVIGVSPENT